MRDSLRPEGGLTFGLLRVGASLFAIDVAQMREVVRGRAVTPLPRAPRLIEGVLDLRGAIVPVVDLARALAGGRVEEGARTRVALVEVDGLMMGLRVDAALGVLSVLPSALEDPPALALQAGYDAVRAVIRQPDGEPILLLSVEAILENVYRSALPQAEDAA